MKAGHPKILIAEDEADVCNSIKSFLSKRGFEVITTGSGTEAFSLVEKSKPDIIILDLRLKDMNGQIFLRRLRENDKNTKVIITTGDLLKDEKQEIISLGVSEYLNKPTFLNELLEIIIKVWQDDYVPQEVNKPKIIGESKESSRLIIHKLKDLQGSIRNPCEDFISSFEEGLLEDRSEKELIEMSLEIMKGVIKNIDKATSVVEKIEDKK